MADGRTEGIGGNGTGMPQQVTKAQLTPGRKRLVEWMQRMYYGRIEGLPVRGGQPVCDPPPRLVREVKLDGERGPHTMLSREDFVLKAQVQELFAQIEMIGDGVILVIEVRNGLPVKMVFEEEVGMKQPGRN